MKIVVNNIDRLLRLELGKICEIVEMKDKPNGVFIQWATGESDDLFQKQTKIIAKCISDGIPLIIFDKYQKMTAEEVGFLIKPGIFLWEPALNDRMFFSFQPIWGRIPKTTAEVKIPNSDRGLDFAYTRGLRQKLSTFEQYYRPINDVGEKSVGFVDRFANPAINQRVVEMDIDIYTSWDLTQVRTTMLLGTDRDYRVGYLDPNLFSYLENGVIPMLPREHRWYHSVFKDVTVRDDSDINMLLNMYDKFAFALVYDVYRGLENNLPECDVVNVAKRITTFFK